MHRSRIIRVFLKFVKNRKFSKLTRNTFCRTRSLSNATFSHFWSRDVHPVQNLLLCTKFRQNRMIFRWDMAIQCITIFKMAAVRHLGIVLPPYETTHEVCCWPQLSVKFHVNLIHRSEDRVIWIFLHIQLSVISYKIYSARANFVIKRNRRRDQTRC